MKNGECVGRYTITYNANDGSGMPTILYDYDCYGSCYTKIREQVQGPIPNARLMESWNTSPDGTGTRYGFGSLITPTSDTTLFAQWPD